MFFIDTASAFSSRMDLSRLVFFDAEKESFDIVTSFFVDEVRNLPVLGIYLVSGEEFRWDLISFVLYKNVAYWWVLAIYNNVTNPDRLSAGTLVSYPSLNDIESLFFSLKGRSQR